MKKSILSVLLVLVSFCASANLQTPTGTWQGVIIQKGKTIDAGTLIYVEFEEADGIISGTTREERYDSPNYSVKSISGKLIDGKLSFKHLVELKSKKSSREKWCRISADLRHNKETGYLIGSYVSTDCRRVMGEIILYRMDFKMTEEAEMESSQIWFKRFVQDYKDGLSAPTIRKIERDNFVFEPIYFDFDKHDVRMEHNHFLDRMIKIVKGHSDLRVQVTGHTDSDGTNRYNDSLSMRRADAITRYFVLRGLSADRLEIDFKGESQPADTNDTPQGKQRNRRVDFKFI